MEVKTEKKCYYSINSPQKKAHDDSKKQQKYDHLMYHFV